MLTHYKFDGVRLQPCRLLFIQHARSIKSTFTKHNGDLMKHETANCRINAKISKQNYVTIDEMMENEQLISMKLSKGAILDIALSCLFISLECESLESLAIQHLERIEDLNVDNTLAGDGV